MKINLCKVEVKSSLIAPTKEENLNPLIAEHIYKTCSTLEEKLFAEKMFKCDGEMEITETERQLILSKINDFYYWLKDPIIKILENSENGQH